MHQLVKIVGGGDSIPQGDRNDCQTVAARNETYDTPGVLDSLRVIFQGKGRSDLHNFLVVRNSVADLLLCLEGPSQIDQEGVIDVGHDDLLLAGVVHHIAADKHLLGHHLHGVDCPRVLPVCMGGGEGRQLWGGGPTTRLQHFQFSIGATCGKKKCAVKVHIMKETGKFL